MLEYLHLDGAGQVSSKRLGEPKPVVGMRAGIEADEQVNGSHALGQCIHVGVEIRTTTLLTSFNEEQHSAMRQACSLHGFKSEKRSEG